MRRAVFVTESMSMPENMKGKAPPITSPTRVRGWMASKMIFSVGGVKVNR